MDEQCFEARCAHLCALAEPKASPLLRGGVLKLVTFQRMPKLIVAKVQRCRRSALIEPVPAQRFFEQSALVVGDC